MTETTTTILQNERPDSIGLNTNSKGEIQWEVKAYGDTATAEGLEDLVKRVGALKARAMELSGK